MSYFDCFGLVGKLEFHVCADKTSNRQYLGDMTWLPVSLFKRFFQAQTTSPEILRKLYKTQFITVFPQKT